MDCRLTDGGPVTWLTHLSGFQLFVIGSLLDIEFWQAGQRWDKEHKTSTAVSILWLSASSIAVSVVWFTYAAWPVIR